MPVGVDSDPMIGRTIEGRYQIVELIGRGGMGVVYRATELALDRPVALKLIAPELAGDDSFRERFLRESRIAASIDHAGILPVYAAGEADGELYLATRLDEITVPAPFAHEAEVIALGFAPEPLRAAKLPNPNGSK